MVSSMQQHEEHKSFHRLQEKITPHVLGLLWITQKDIKEREEPFGELNYFFDATLGKRIFFEPLPAQTHLFVSNHYQNPVYLGTVKHDRPQLGQALNQLLRVMQGRAVGRKKVLVVLKEQSFFPASVTKANPSLDFDFLLF